MTINMATWLAEHKIDEVECIVPDINGVQRGKVLPAKKFLSSMREKSLRIPGSIFICTIDGHYPDDISDIWDKDPDKTLIPDAETLCLAPGFKSPTAFVIADVYNSDGSVVDLSPRALLKKVLSLYAAKGWRPIVAPEVEFYLVSQNIDPDFPLTPPTGQSGRAETASQPYGLEAMNEYEDIIDHIYDDCELMGLDIDTMIHEMGAAQLEVNFIHGDPLKLADSVFLFKRVVRNVAKQHGVYATFMANPIAGQPGSAMHIHQSVVDLETGKNLFSTSNGRDSALFRSYIAGLIRLMPQISPMWAPNVNSFRRMRPDSSAPINVQWGEDNRSCGFRVPISDKHNRRVENRLPGADSNPYLAMAASLVCGYVGMVERMVPAKAITGSAYNRARTLPRTLESALDRFYACKKVRALLGDDFFEIFFAIKDHELFNYQSVVSSWEREHLLLRV
jgi:glutamine synthetase